MKAIDFDYIERRLLEATSTAMDAHERLKTVDPKLAEEFMGYTQDFNDKCRMVRAEISTSHKRGS